MNHSTQKNIHTFSALAKQKALWHEPSLSEKSPLPAPIANEYRTLFELTEQDEVYQAVVKLKDFAEVCYRAVVLTAIATVSRQATAKGESVGTAFALLSDFLTKPPSIGNWEDKLTSIKNDYSALLPPALSDVIGKVNEMKNKLQMSAYRNEYIGHGAYMATASETLAKDTKQKLTVLVKALSELYPMWASFTIELQGKPQQGWQAVRRPAFHSEKVSVKCGDKAVPVSQFILFEDKRYYWTRLFRSVNSFYLRISAITSLTNTTAPPARRNISAFRTVGGCRVRCRCFLISAGLMTAPERASSTVNWTAA